MNTLRLFDLAYNQLNKFPNPNMFVTKANGKWEGVSTSDFLKLAMETSRGLIALGVNPGDRIAVVSSNRVEWNTMDIAIQQIGAIMVPIYPNISEADYKYIFNNAGVRFCVVGNEELFQKISNIKDSITTLQKTYTFDLVNNAHHWLEIAALAGGVSEDEVKKRSEEIKNTDMVTIIYTSGTTGNPKGVMLSHNNILSNVLACQPRIPADQYSRVLTFLPVCHIYERMLHYLYIHLGASIYFAESLDTIGDNIREVKPHVFTAVPRLLEKVFDKIMAKGDELTGIKRKLFFWAVELAEEYDVKGKSGWYHFRLNIARKLIFSKWQEALGGEVRAIASGSAALQPRLARIFLAAGVNVLEGYGLTETSPVVSVNCLKNGIRIGTVGPLIDGVEVKIAEDGEILVKGPNVMMGYYNNPEATAEAIDAQGWFHTGDIGDFVEGKFLRITDRKKEMFKTSGGKFVVPQIMENTFKESRFIEQIMVLGEGQKFPSALIVPNFSFVKDWAERKGFDLRSKSNQEIIENTTVVERIGKEVTEFNKKFGHWEQIKKFELLPTELSVEGGELTPTLKLKRKIILEKYKALVDKIYSN
ncbi:long-chain fatty acid--CoA ligase [Crocinitomicaceae bacterium CZZ-1]|uniref:Long-chain fatty acid--CoA ligase n=1 Tax=Taishania pollutisoli TaxID=2766479 RepID=A0A8J6PDI2_9FLAO|nr:long-chain fatty acid--CoA ligase [Taishania pollutisoli]MBC9813242.1 long-chain fatty acid--CoA ligase [Taishania pollutisoli]